MGNVIEFRLWTHRREAKRDLQGSEAARSKLSSRKGARKIKGHEMGTPFDPDGAA